MERTFLCDEFIANFQQSTFDIPSRNYLSLDRMVKLLTKKAVHAEMGYITESDSHMEICVNFVLQKAMRVFATTVWIGLQGKDLYLVMEFFRAHEFDDSQLHVTQENLSAMLLRDNSGKTCSWGLAKIYRFCEAQWIFHVPVFEENKRKLILTSNHVLPFFRIDGPTKEGGFSEVSAVRIDPAHVNSPYFYGEFERPAKFAIKEFKTFQYDAAQQLQADRVWRSEVNALESLGKVPHSNLIRRIGSIERGPQRILLFLWADGGNMRDYWKENRNIHLHLTGDLVKEVIEQFRGMADALKQLHTNTGRVHYRHGDIKPENILRFPVPNEKRIGTFMISDLGSAKDHIDATAVREWTKDSAFATKVYQPPEIETRAGKATSRLYDIWSMGCVTLEFMIWLLYGYNGLEHFENSMKTSTQNERSEFYIIKGTGLRKEAEVHPVVLDWMKNMSKNPECASSTALGKLLEVVKTKLLIVQPQVVHEISPQHKQSCNSNLLLSTYLPKNTERRTDAQGFFDALNQILGYRSIEGQALVYRKSTG